MNQYLKHLIIGTFSLVILFVTLFIPKEYESFKDVKSIKLGYPVAFVSQDFSAAPGIAAKWFYRIKFEKKLPIKIIWINLVLSYLVVFLIAEILIFILESIKIWILKGKE